MGCQGDPGTDLHRSYVLKHTGVLSQMQRSLSPTEQLWETGCCTNSPRHLSAAVGANVPLNGQLLCPDSDQGVI